MNLVTPKQAARSEKRILPALTGIRFLAAIWVVCFHFCSPLAWGIPGAPTLALVSGMGYLGVGLFFVLSGFILSYVYSAVDFSQRDRRVDFWKGRFIRIYPLYFLSLLFATPFVLTHRFATDGLHVAIWKAALSFGSSALLLQAWFPPMSSTWNGPGWSLSAEMFFYVLFPVLFAMLNKFRSRTQLVSIASCLWIICLMIGFVVRNIAPTAASAGQIMNMPILQLPQFIIGMCFGVLYNLGIRRPGKKALFVPDLLVVVGVFGIVAGVLVADKIENVFYRSGILAPFIGILLFGLASGANTGRLIGGKAWSLLGEASYPLYLFQYIIWWTAASILVKGFHRDIVATVFSQLGTGSIQLFLINSVTLVVVSVIALKFVDVWIRHHVRGRWFQPLPNHHVVLAPQELRNQGA